MKYNTVLAGYPHKAFYYTWETEDRNGVDYRKYAEGVEVTCRLGLNNMGNAVLFADQELQEFGVLEGFTDGSRNAAGEGQPIMPTKVFWVVKSAPLINPVGIVYGYFHTLANPTHEQLAGPLTTRTGAGFLDQVG